jgi:calcium permeable stress-gated cation channel
VSRNTFDTHDEELIEDVGYDGVAFLRLLATLIKLFALGSVTVMPVLLTLNIQDGKPSGVHGMDRFNWGNIKSTNANRYWGHCCCAAFFVACTIYAIDTELKRAVQVRQALLSRPSTLHIVLVSDVPSNMLEEDKMALFYEQAIQRPASIDIVHDVRSLTQQIRRRKDALKKLEQIATSLFQHRLIMQNSASHREKLPACSHFRILDKLPWTNPERKLEHYGAQVADCNEAIAAQQRNASQLPVTGAALMTFPSSVIAIALEKVFAFPTPDCMVATYLGTQPGSLKWENLGVTGFQVRLRHTLSDTLIIFLTLIWAIPIALTGVLSQVAYLSQVTVRGAWVVHLPTSVLALLQGVLPQVTLTVLMAVFPFLLKIMINLRRLPSKVMDEGALQSRYFAFLFLHQFLTVSISSSAIAILAGFLNRTESIPTVLATNIPKASNYFLSYIPLEALYCSSMDCLQPLAFLGFLKGRLTDNTAREKFSRRNSISLVQWGLVYPLYTNLACIGRKRPRHSVDMTLTSDSYNICHYCAYNPTTSPHCIHHLLAMLPLLCCLYREHIRRK